MLYFQIFAGISESAPKYEEITEKKFTNFSEEDEYSGDGFDPDNLPPDENGSIEKATTAFRCYIISCNCSSESLADNQLESHQTSQ